MMRVVRRSLAVVGFGWLLFASVAVGERNPGPWNLAALAAVPEVDWVETDGAVRSLFYAGEPYAGRSTRVFAYYAVPKVDGPAKVDGKLPGMVLVHGGGGTAFKEWAELWAKRGYAAIAMDLAGCGAGRKRLADGGPGQGHVQKFHHISRGVKEAWPYHAVANVIRAVSLLGGFKEVDPQRIGITGISWGGYLTCIVAGLDDRLKVAVPVYGCGFLRENSAWLKEFAKMPAKDRDLWIKNFDPSQHLAGCAMPMLFVNGTNDFAYPLDSYQKSYRLVPEPRTLCVTVRMPHGHPAGWAPKEIGIFVDSVLRSGEPLARFETVSREGKEVVATFRATVPVTEAALHYTADRGPWKERTWKSLPAELDGNRVRATLPTDEGIVYFLTVTDARKAVVSTEHETLNALDVFPVSAQFSPVPSGKGWKGQEGPLSEQVLRETIDNIREHGITGLEAPTHRPKGEEAFLLKYAQQCGMIITYHAGALEVFGRNKPPKTCVYSPEYAKAVRRNAEQRLAPLKGIRHLYNVFTFQDEPFHWGPTSFGYNDEVKAEFKKRHGYDLPPDLDSIRDDARKWLDVINFRSDYFPDGWRQVYKIVKEIDPGFKTVLTHDSHNTFGAGYSSHSEIAIDDVFHWGGDFSDMFVFDIYPYMMFDFRFGEVSKLPKPRISQTHYSFAQMRNLTRTYGKALGFWVGTYNPAWFKEFLCPELRAKYWSEREMSTTAVAQGADFLLTGYKIPIDAAHWDSFGEGLRLIQKAGGRLLAAPKVKAKACMLFPRTHYIQLQEEYFNVGLSFELFLRAFGELDILHEEQVVDDNLDGYKILVLFDVKLLPRAVAERIASFVRKGGVVIADCVPRMDTYKKPMGVMEELFGVKDAEASRIRRSGHWVPYKTRDPIWANRPKDPSDESVFTTDTLKGAALAQALDLTLVSPRPCRVTTGKILIETGSGQPGVVGRKVGKGRVFLLGFCVQDTYFKTWQDEDEAARGQLRGLIGAMTRTSGVRPHVCSTNPDIEASIRANPREGFLFIINHEAQGAKTTVRLADLSFEIKRITNLADDQPVPFTHEDGVVELEVSTPIGQSRLLHLHGKVE